MRVPVAMVAEIECCTINLKPSLCANLWPGGLSASAAPGWPYTILIKPAIETAREGREGRWTAKVAVTNSLRDSEFPW